MAILALSFLSALSFRGAETLLFQEGYIQERRVEKGDEPWGRKFLYPYSLYDENGKRLDRIYYIEYCRRTVDVEYADGRMTWEAVKEEWGRE